MVIKIAQILFVFVTIFAVNSVKIQPTLSQNCIRVFDSCNYRGNSKLLCENVANIKNLNFTNKIQSIAIGPKTNVLTYKSDNFKTPNNFIEKNVDCIKDQLIMSFELNVTPEEVFNNGLKDNYNLWTNKWKLKTLSEGVFKVEGKGKFLGIVISSAKNLNKSFYEIEISENSITIFRRKSKSQEKVKLYSVLSKNLINQNQFKEFKIIISKYSRRIIIQNETGAFLLNYLDFSMPENLKWISVSNGEGEAELKDLKIITIDKKSLSEGKKETKRRIVTKNNGEKRLQVVHVVKDKNNRIIEEKTVKQSITIRALYIEPANNNKKNQQQNTEIVKIKEFFVPEAIYVDTSGNKGNLKNSLKKQNDVRK